MSTKDSIFLLWEETGIAKGLQPQLGAEIE
jgi:hypothetical protein